jgi:hypothetical protein
MKRRDLLGSTLALLASPSLAKRAPITVLTDYERDSGGRVGLWAENQRTGTKIVWRAHPHDTTTPAERVVYLSKRDFSPFMMRLFAYQSHSSGSSRDSSGVQC